LRAGTQDDGRIHEDSRAVRPADRDLPGRRPARRRRLHRHRGHPPHRPPGRVAARRGIAGDGRGGGGQVLGRRRRATRRARRSAPPRRHRRRPRLPAPPLLPLGEGARAHPGRGHPAAPQAGRHPRRGAGLTGPDQITVRRDGLDVNALDWGGGGTPLLLLHPNGMGAGLFEPLALAVRDAFRPVAVDLRGHGGTRTPAPPAGFRFAETAADVLAVLDHLGIDETVTLGESLGGGVSVLVDGQRPGVIRRLLLCEPVAFSPDGRTLRPPGTGSGDGGNYMSTIARRRRAVWPDRDAVYKSYRSRPPFDVVAPEALAAYVRWGFVDRPDGQVELACKPEIEATIFEVSGEPIGAPAAWAHLGELTAHAVLACGEQSELPAEWF